MLKITVPPTCRSWLGTVRTIATRHGPVWRSGSRRLGGRNDFTVCRTPFVSLAQTYTLGSHGQGRPPVKGHSVGCWGGGLWHCQTTHLHRLASHMPPGRICLQALSKNWLFKIKIAILQSRLKFFVIGILLNNFFAYNLFVESQFKVRDCNSLFLEFQSIISLAVI